MRESERFILRALCTEGRAEAFDLATLMERRRVTLSLQARDLGATVDLSLPAISYDLQQAAGCNTDRIIDEQTRRWRATYGCASMEADRGIMRYDEREKKRCEEADMEREVRNDLAFEAEQDRIVALRRAARKLT
jgi:hypothetical protein